MTDAMRLVSVLILSILCAPATFAQHAIRTEIVETDIGANFSAEVRTENTVDIAGNSVRNVFRKEDPDGWLFHVPARKGTQTRIMVINLEKPTYVTKLTINTCNRISKESLPILRAAKQGVGKNPLGSQFIGARQQDMKDSAAIEFKEGVNDTLIKTKTIYIDAIVYNDKQQHCIKSISLELSDKLPYDATQSWDQLRKNLLGIGASTDKYWSFPSEELPFHYYANLLFYVIQNNSEALRFAEKLRASHLDEHSLYTLPNIKHDLANISEFRCGKSTMANGCGNYYISDYNWIAETASHLSSETFQYSIKNLFDGKKDSAWCSGVINSGNSQGEIYIQFLELTWVQINNIRLEMKMAKTEGLNSVFPASVDVYIASESEFIEHGNWTLVRNIELGRTKSLNPYVVSVDAGMDVFGVKLVMHGDTPVCLSELSVVGY